MSLPAYRADIDSCLHAFADCHADSDDCQPEAVQFVSACAAAWNTSSGADCSSSRVAACREAARRFYAATTTAPRTDFSFRFRRALLFCRCADGNENDDGDDGRGACRAVRGVFQRPSCTAVALPPPDCRDVIERCDNDDECRSANGLTPMCRPTPLCSVVMNRCFVM